MKLQQLYRGFIVVCMAVSDILARRSEASLVAGIAGGLAVGMLPLLLLGTVVALMLARYPERPPCVCGKCNSQEYEYLGPMQETADNVY